MCFCFVFSFILFVCFVLFCLLNWVFNELCVIGYHEGIYIYKVREKTRSCFFPTPIRYIELEKKQDLAFSLPLYVI